MHAFLIGDPHIMAVAQQSGLLGQFDHVQPTDATQLAARLRSLAPVSALVLVLLAELDADLLLNVDDLCARLGVRWLSLHFEQGVGWLGPAIDARRTISYRDLLRRRLCAAASTELHAAWLAPTACSYRPPQPELLWMLALLCSELEQWLAGRPCRLVNAELRADPIALATTHHPVLPMPDGQVSTMYGHDEESGLVSARAGIILNLIPTTHHASVPEQLATVQAYLPTMQRAVPSWYNVTTSLGSSFDGLAAARLSAMGEAIERYCMNYMTDAAALKASYRELIARDEPALDPAQLALFSDALYAAPGCPFARFTPTMPVYWVRGQSLTRQRAAWLPVSLVYTNWQSGPFAEQALVSDINYPGVAAGRTLEQAIVGAIEELIERDSMMIWWMNRQPLPAITLPSDLATIWAGQPDAAGQRAWAIAIPNEFDIPVIAGVVEQTVERLLTIGFACRPDSVAATRKAWAEALTLQERSRDLAQPDSLLRQELAADGAAGVLKPWRADRAYRDAYRPDFRDMAHTVCAEQFYLDPRAIEQVRAWVDVPATVCFEQLPSLLDRTLATYQQRLEARGYEIFCHDLTTRDARMAGWHVVRVIIPGLIPEFPAAFPHIGGGRVQRMAVALGWRKRVLEEEELNYLPLPYA